MSVFKSELIQALRILKTNASYPKEAVIETIGGDVYITIETRLRFEPISAFLNGWSVSHTTLFENGMVTFTIPFGAKLTKL